jgi:hypothetical protein
MNTHVTAGRRIADTINNACLIHEFDEVVRSFMAFSLDDGSSDNVLYPSVREARKHQKGDYNHYVYFSLREAPGGITEKAAFHVLLYARAARDAGMRMPDPDSTYGDHAPVTPLCEENRSEHISEFLQRSGFTLARYTKG